MNRVGIVALLLTWSAVVSGGFALLLRYKNTPAEAHRPPARWPRESRLARAANPRATLVLFAHPECPCTRASVSELARLVAGAQERLAAHVVVVRPSDAPESWDDSELRQRAASIPGAAVTRDDAGVEAARFRAAASGYAVLYDADGRLRFSGGLTSSRGHEGDSFGRRRILAVLSGQTPDREDAPVFGCALGVNHLDNLEGGSS